MDNAREPVIETPVVVINCQRAGPSTGVPTKTEQGDLWQMLGAAFGDYPRVIAAPLDIGDCFKLIPETFNLADRFQRPGLVNNKALFAALRMFRQRAINRENIFSQTQPSYSLRSHRMGMISTGISSGLTGSHFT